jgi:hypothetical protein
MMSKLDRAIDELIRRAIKEGKFKDLAGKGKPFRLLENPYEDPDWRMAFHALKSSGHSLPWISTRREILDDLQAARSNLERSFAWKEAALEEDKPKSWVEEEWSRAQDEFREKIDELNQRISSYNVEAPSSQFQLRKVHADREIKKITANK